jgi:FkbM family methyltransferase
METPFRAISWLVRNIPVNRKKDVFIRWSAHLKVRPSFTFYSRRLKLRWSAKGFPDILTRHMLFEGMYQEEVLTAIESLVRPADTVIDAGGHHGLMAIVASKAVGPTGLVVSFEPNPHARTRFLENCALSGVQNVRLAPLALSDKPGSRKFYVQKGAVSWNSSFFAGFASQSGRDSTEEIEVAVTTIEDYVTTNGLAPAFIKIDAEGSEFLILNGAGKTIREHRPVISMEFNPDSARAADTTIEKTQQFLEGIGYHLVALHRSQLGFYRFNDQEPFNSETHAAENLCNVLCIPSPKGIAVQQLG